jgi:ketosteroid isomerase-like protein
MDHKTAAQFADEWIGAWNAHDLDRVLSHYSDDFEMTSPMIAQIVQVPSGTLRGKSAVAAYWKKALAIIPDLHFELLHVFAGVDSVVIYYKGARGRLSAEVLYFGPDQKVVKAGAHYVLSGV